MVQFGTQMKRIDLNQDIRPLSEFRANAAALIERVRSTKRPMVITQHGKSSAVILDVQEYEALLDRLELLQDVQTAEAELEAGLGVGHDEAKRQVLSRIRASK